MEMEILVNKMYEDTAMNADICTVCPLCSNHVRFFYLAMDEKILMCENIKCEFPFGYKDFKIIKEDDVGFEMSQGSTSKSTSLNSWMDFDRISYDSENCPNQVRCFNGFHEGSNMQKIEDQIASEKQMVKNLNDLKGLTKKFNDIEEDSNDVIKNKKFIKKLMKLQNLSGVKLVKQEEMDVIRQERPVYKRDELKIDIDTSGSSLCAIKIEITQNNTTAANVT